MVLKPNLSKFCGWKQAWSVWNKYSGVEVLDSGVVEPLSWCFWRVFWAEVCLIWTSKPEKQDNFGSLKPQQASGYWLKHSNIHHSNVRWLMPDTLGFFFTTRFVWFWLQNQKNEMILADDFRPTIFGSFEAKFMQILWLKTNLKCLKKSHLVLKYWIVKWLNQYLDSFGIFFGQKFSWSGWFRPTISAA